MPDPLPTQGTSRRAFFSRHFAPLIIMWAVAIVGAALIYWFEIEMPAFHDVVMPVYEIIAVAAVFFTWRWIRTRGKGDRRDADRRRIDRRNTTEYSAKPPEP